MTIMIPRLSPLSALIDQAKDEGDKKIDQSVSVDTKTEFATLMTGLESYVYTGSSKIKIDLKFYKGEELVLETCTGSNMGCLDYEHTLSLGDSGSFEVVVRLVDKAGEIVETVLDPKSLDIKTEIIDAAENADPALRCFNQSELDSLNTGLKAFLDYASQDEMYTSAKESVQASLSTSLPGLLQAYTDASDDDAKITAAAACSQGLVDAKDKIVELEANNIMCPNSSAELAAANCQEYSALFTSLDEN